MPNEYEIWNTGQERRRDLLREARQARLVRQAAANEPKWAARRAGRAVLRFLQSMLDSAHKQMLADKRM